MRAGDEFDEWAAAGRDRGMEERHWRRAKHALRRMPIEDGDAVLDLGAGSGYAARALLEAGGAARAVGVDASPEMVGNARAYTSDAGIEAPVEFVVGEFEHLPLPDDAVDHAFSMEAIYYASDPQAALAELRRVLRPGGTFYCAVDYWEEHHHAHDWQELVDVEMTLWSEAEYRQAFRDAGFHVAGQDRIADEETEIPPADAFPTDDFETREAMVERYREFGTLLTVGVVP